MEGQIAKDASDEQKAAWDELSPALRQEWEEVVKIATRHAQAKFVKEYKHHMQNWLREITFTHPFKARDADVPKSEWSNCRKWLKREFQDVPIDKWFDHADNEDQTKKRRVNDQLVAVLIADSPLGQMWQVQEDPIE